MGHSKRAARTYLWVAFILFAFTGCDLPAVFLDAFPVSAKSGQQATAAEDAVEMPDGPPEELAKRLEQSLREAADMDRLLARSQVNEELRVAQLTRIVNTGVAAAEKLLQNGEAHDGQRSMAQKGRLALLCLGAKHDRESFLPRLESCVAALRQDKQRSLAAIGDAALVELNHLDAGDVDKDALPALVEYAQNYPDCGAGVALFQLHGRQLESAKRFDEAKRCYRTAVDLYGHLAESKTLSDRLNRLEQRDRAAQRHRQTKQKQLDQIRRQLGNRDDGYFVIYTYEVKPPSGQMIEFYSFQYEVLRGRDAAATYIAGLKPNWQWELVRRFPDTPAAYSQATELAKDLTKKRSFIQY